ncbi:MAG: pilus assembly protein PilM [Phycisphaeraceae bacterium]|nr:pilus assembly protein PilM [Phycisphaeraceae bacterium]
MLSGLFKQPRCPIGIDVGTRGVRMMQVDRQADRLVVLAAARQNLDVEADGCGEKFHQAVATAIRSMLDEGQFTGNLAVSCLPAAAVHYKNLRLPKMPPHELPAAVQWEANDRLHLGEPAVTQFIDAGVVHQGEEQRQEIILLAATNSIIEQHARALSGTGLQLIAIDAIPTALARCFGRDDPEHVQVIIDIGYTQSKVLICRGQHVLFYKQIDLGGLAFDQEIARQLELSLAEAGEVRRTLQNRETEVRKSVEDTVRPLMNDLGREIALCLRYYSVTFRGERPAAAVLIGNETYDAALVQAIRQSATIEVRVSDPLAGLDLSRVGPLEGHRDWAPAAGLALRPMDKAAGKRGAA